VSRRPNCLTRSFLKEELIEGASLASLASVVVWQGVRSVWQLGNLQPLKDRARFFTVTRVREEDA
jgi:hypothetical protein